MSTKYFLIYTFMITNIGEGVQSHSHTIANNYQRNVYAL